MISTKEKKDTNSTSEALGQKPILAVFDFDKTLSDRHSFWRFLRYVSGPFAFYISVFIFIPALLRYFRGKEKLMTVREKVIVYFLKGMPAEKYLFLSHQFARTHLPKYINPSSIERLKWHQRMGHETILLSNASEDYLKPWAEAIGFELVMGSRFEIGEGKMTGRLIGDHCYGQEKVNRLTAVKGDLSKYSIYMYGDSEGDKELLALADYPYYRIFDKENAQKLKETYQQSSPQSH